MCKLLPDPAEDLMFDGFVDEQVDVGEVDLRVRHAGEGPAVLLARLFHAGR